MVRKRYAVPALVCAVALVGTVILVALTRGGSVARGAGTDGRADVRWGEESFKISGEAVNRLSPGRSVPINVRVTNGASSRLRVTELRVRVLAVRAPNADERHPCSRHDFALRQVRPSFAVTVPAHATRSLRSLGVPRKAWPRVRMLNRPVDQDGCKGASIILAHVGSGRLQR